MRTPGHQYRVRAADVLAFCAREQLETPPFLVSHPPKVYVVGAPEPLRRTVKRAAGSLSVHLFPEVHAGLFATVLDPPNLLVLDAGCGGYSPEPALEALRATTPTARVPIVATSVPNAARCAALVRAGATRAVLRTRREDVGAAITELLGGGLTRP
jgi:hypothetical protein